MIHHQSQSRYNIYDLSSSHSVLKKVTYNILNFYFRIIGIWHVSTSHVSQEPANKHFLPLRILDNSVTKHSLRRCCSYFALYRENLQFRGRCQLSKRCLLQISNTLYSYSQH